MPFICDAHVHFYSCFKLEKCFEKANENLNSLLRAHGLPENTTKLLCLTERFDCDYFTLLSKEPDTLKNENIKIEKTNDEFALKVTLKDGQSVYLIAGRQIVTQEKVELLALCMNEKIADGLSLAQTIKDVSKHKGILVLNWAPGKWMFRRKSLVSKLINEHTNSTLALGDTTLRPNIWCEPLLMRKGSKKGLSIIAGSDPLPLENEFLLIGSYCLLYDGPFDETLAAESFKRIILGDFKKPRRVGKRSSLLGVIKRLLAHRNVGKLHKESGLLRK